MNCWVINVSQVVRRGPKLANNEKNAASKNGLFPLVIDYSYLAFPTEGKERWADAWNCNRNVTKAEWREVVRSWLILSDKIHEA